MECGKIKHPTKELAIARIKRLYRKNRKRRSQRGQIHPYFCPQCGAWHVGHDKGWEQFEKTSSTYNKRREIARRKKRNNRKREQGQEEDE